MDIETLREAIDADENDQIECPVCGDQIRAYKLGSDHAHPRQLLKLVEFLLSETTDEGFGVYDDCYSEREDERDVMKGFGSMEDVEGFREAVEEVDWDAGDSDSPTDDA